MTAEHLDGSRYLQHLRASGVEMPNLGERVLLALHPAARPRRARLLGGPFGSVETTRFGPDVTTVAPLGPGPAVAAMTIEMLAGLGVVEVVAVGVVSRVWSDEDPPEPGAVLVVESAVTDDSVSARYGGQMTAACELSGRLRTHLEAESAKAYSTSTPFRLDVSAVLESGADVVDMEAAALFSSASTFEIAVALAIVISDSTTLAGWQPGDVGTVRRRVGEVASRCRALLGRDA